MEPLHGLISKASLALCGSVGFLAFPCFCGCIGSLWFHWFSLAPCGSWGLATVPVGSLPWLPWLPCHLGLARVPWLGPLTSMASLASLTSWALSFLAFLNFELCLPEHVDSSMMGGEPAKG